MTLYRRGLFVLEHAHLRVERSEEATRDGDGQHLHKSVGDDGYGRPGIHWLAADELTLDGNVCIPADSVVDEDSRDDSGPRQSRGEPR